MNDKTNLYNKTDDSYSMSTIAREVDLSIDTDAVMTAINQISTALNSFKTLESFNLKGAWESDNATKVMGKLGEIKVSISDMKDILEKLSNKVNSYLTNIKKSDSVLFENEQDNSRTYTSNIDTLN